jgi:hypothetical protein
VDPDYSKTNEIFLRRRYKPYRTVFETGTVLRACLEVVATESLFEVVGNKDGGFVKLDFSDDFWGSDDVLMLEGLLSKT